MPRKPIKPRKTKQSIPAALVSYFLTGSYADFSIDEQAECFYMCLDEKKLKALWDSVKGDLTREFVKQNPGELPAACNWTWAD